METNYTIQDNEKSTELKSIYRALDKTKGMFHLNLDLESVDVYESQNDRLPLFQITLKPLYLSQGWFYQVEQITYSYSKKLKFQTEREAVNFVNIYLKAINL